MEEEGEGEEEGGKDSRHLPPPSLLLPLPSPHAGSPLPGDSWMLFLHCGWKVGAYCGAGAGVVDVTVPPATLTPSLSITPHLLLCEVIMFVSCPFAYSYPSCIIFSSHHLHFLCLRVAFTEGVYCKC